MSQQMSEPVVPQAAPVAPPPWGPAGVQTTAATAQPAAPEPAAVGTGAPKHAVPKPSDGSAAATPWGKAAGAAATPWAQRRGPVKPHATARLRKTIEGLPDWEPLPPGEVFVQRGRGDG